MGKIKKKSKQIRNTNEIKKCEKRSTNEGSFTKGLVFFTVDGCIKRVVSL